MVDPYVVFGKVQETATAPFYDWLLGLIAWIAGFGSPSESLLHNIAAWYPVVLASGMVVAIFLLGRLLFGWRAALFAAAIIATLPGHYLHVSSLGFTDHHIMESLLVTLFFFLLLRAMKNPPALGISLAAGFTLAAYLLTFHGSAITVGIVIAWALFERVRWFQSGQEAKPSFRPLYISFLLALSVCLVFRHLLWMNYTILALELGIASLLGVEWWAKLSRRNGNPAVRFFGGLSVATVAAATIVALFAKRFDLRHSVKMVVTHLAPSLFGTSGGVYELQSLIYELDHYTLLPAIRQFWGAYFLALIGLFVLVDYLFYKKDSGRSLVFFWGAIMFVLAMGELRMTYYYAIGVALASGYAADRLVAIGRRSAWLTFAGLALLVFAPNLYAAINADTSAGASADWKESLDWMRTSTPEPFGDPNFFYARYRGRDFGPNYRYPPFAYSVMAWWDYGYLIIDVGRRIPVTNPTQANAGAAASFFLAQSEAEAIPILREWRTRYVIVDERLPLWPSDEALLVGDFPSFFEYSTTHRKTDYLLLAYQLNPVNPEGKPLPKIFYRPAYYRSMAIRLFAFGGQSAKDHQGAVLLWLEEKKFPNGKSYQQIVDTKRFESLEEAAAAEAVCRDRGCQLVSDNPLVSCTQLEPLKQLRVAFASTSSSVGFGRNGRKAVQVYEFIGRE